MFPAITTECAPAPLAVICRLPAEVTDAVTSAEAPALPLIADRELRAKRAYDFLQRLGVRADEVKALPQRQLRRAAGRLQMKSAATSPTLAYGLTYGVDLLGAAIGCLVSLALLTLMDAPSAMFMTAAVVAGAAWCFPMSV